MHKAFDNSRFEQNARANRKLQSSLNDDMSFILHYGQINNRPNETCFNLEYRPNIIADKPMVFV